MKPNEQKITIQDYTDVSGIPCEECGTCMLVKALLNDLNDVKDKLVDVEDEHAFFMQGYEWTQKQLKRDIKFQQSFVESLENQVRDLETELQHVKNEYTQRDDDCKRLFSEREFFSKKCYEYANTVEFLEARNQRLTSLYRKQRESGNFTTAYFKLELLLKITMHELIKAKALGVKTDVVNLDAVIKNILEAINAQNELLSEYQTLVRAL